MAFISRGTPGIRAAQWPFSSSNQAPGGGAVGVGQLVPPHRHHGLFAVVFRWGCGRAGKKVHDLPPFFRVKGQRIAKGVGHRFLWSGRRRWGQARRKTPAVAAAREVATSSFRAGGVVPPPHAGCSTVMPSSASSRLKNWALVLTMSPSKSSVPTQMISAVHGDIPSLGKQFKRQAACVPLTFPGRRQYGWGSFPHWRRLPAPARPGRAWRPRRPRSRPGRAGSWGGAG